ncbi:MAG: hypothetical protein IPH43_08395 [Xanthomonadales bacterium]|uniref:hypothetical protein n=1 Tax=Dokdonella sp. TaxID=2291710 RepID=UPI002BC4B727|nr:hypothetical protein [Xanthomonadales bacterium]HQV72948.1 hypothetical protein [Dokdonella sp.]
MAIVIGSAAMALPASKAVLMQNIHLQRFIFVFPMVRPLMAGCHNAKSSDVPQFQPMPPLMPIT